MTSQRTARAGRKLAAIRSVLIRSRAPDAGWEQRLETLTARVEHLEAELEGLQDAVYRQAVLEQENIGDLRRRTEPEQVARDLCRDAAKRQFDMVMAWSVDRLGRSLQDLVAFLSDLHALRIDLFLHQQGIDTTTSSGKAMFQMMGVFAEFERAMIQERVRAGIARARSEGKRLGRPPIPERVEDAIRAALAKPGRPGVRKIAERASVVVVAGGGAPR